MFVLQRGEAENPETNSTARPRFSKNHFDQSASTSSIQLKLACSPVSSERLDEKKRRPKIWEKFGKKSATMNGHDIFELSEPDSDKLHVEASIESHSPAMSDDKSDDSGFASFLNGAQKIYDLAPDDPKISREGFHEKHTKNYEDVKKDGSDQNGQVYTNTTSLYNNTKSVYTRLKGMNILSCPAMSRKCLISSKLSSENFSDFSDQNRKNYVGNLKFFENLQKCPENTQKYEKNQVEMRKNRPVPAVRRTLLEKSRQSMIDLTLTKDHCDVMPDQNIDFWTKPLTTPRRNMKISSINNEHKNQCDQNIDFVPASNLSTFEDQHLKSIHQKIYNNEITTFNVTLHRELDENSGIGVILSGKIDGDSTEIFVHKIIPSSVADIDGTLKKGDIILSINGSSLKCVNPSDARKMLKIPSQRVQFTVSRRL